MDSGFLLIDKPKTWTSFDVCAKLRGILGVKRIGHTGTLDPFATGLLIVAVGKATKLIPFLEKDRKTYVTRIKLGVTSDTLDPTGIVEGEKEKGRREKELKANGQELIAEILKSKFLGKIQQVPPKYSALKVNGKKLYELARAGKEVEIKSRETEVIRAEVLKYEYPYVEIELEVVAGFYVRSFARDLAEELDTVGICWELRRMGVGNISVNNIQYAVYSEKDLKADKKDISHIPSGLRPPPLNQRGGQFELIDPKEVLPIGQVKIVASDLMDFRNGKTVSVSNIQHAVCSEGEKVLVLSDERSVGIGEVTSKGLQPRVVL